MTTSREADLLAQIPTQLFIGGRWRDASDGHRLDVEDPATGQVLAAVADATPADGLDALAAAANAQSEWAAVPARQRAELLRAAYQRIVERTEDFALAMTLEMGKPLAESRGEVAYGAEFFRWFSEEACRIRGSYTSNPAGGSRLLTMRQPVGPTLMITPWNFPLAMGTRKLGPALAAGCTAVVKPARQTPLTMLLLAQTLEEVGVPAGVVNVVVTSRASELIGPLMQDRRLRKVTFTGSTQVGKQLIAQSADQVLRVSMELGGNAPLIVFEDADLDVAIEQTMLAKTRNMGEACTAANRLLVAEPIAEEFADRLATKMGALRLGRGTQDDTQLGPLIDDDARRGVDELVRDALSRGATVRVGGAPAQGPGYFYPGTVLTDVPADAAIVREEIFGPVAPITTFSGEDQAISLANDTTYGLMSYVFTKDLNRALRMAEALDFGMVALNAGVVSNPAAPFGGVKQSGLGREGGAEGIEEFLEVKYVGIGL